MRQQCVKHPQKISVAVLLSSLWMISVSDNAWSHEPGTLFNVADTSGCRDDGNFATYKNIINVAKYSQKVRTAKKSTYVFEFCVEDVSQKIDGQFISIIAYNNQNKEKATYIIYPNNCGLVFFENKHTLRACYKTPGPGKFNANLRYQFRDVTIRR